MELLYDMHCHLDFADNGVSVARESADKGIAAMVSTVVPSSFVSAQERFSDIENIKVALGLHPWWLADGRISEVDIARFETLCQAAPYIGEIGLDMHDKRKESKPRQLAAFERVLDAIEDAGNGKLIFFHAVKAATQLMDMIEEHRTLDKNTCVLHSFAGSHEEFGRAISLGFNFSVSMRMMASEKGELYAASIPDELLMIETDNPPYEGCEWDVDTWRQELENTARALAVIRKVDYESIAKLTRENGMRATSR